MDRAACGARGLAAARAAAAWGQVRRLRCGRGRGCCRSMRQARPAAVTGCYGAAAAGLEPRLRREAVRGRVTARCSGRARASPQARSCVAKHGGFFVRAARSSFARLALHADESHALALNNASTYRQYSAGARGRGVVRIRPPGPPPALLVGLNVQTINTKCLRAAPCRRGPVDLHNAPRSVSLQRPALRDPQAHVARRREHQQCHAQEKLAAGPQAVLRLVNRGLSSRVTRTWASVLRLIAWTGAKLRAKFPALGPPQSCLCTPCTPPVPQPPSLHRTPLPRPPPNIPPLHTAAPAAPPFQLCALHDRAGCTVWSRSPPPAHLPHIASSATKASYACFHLLVALRPDLAALCTSPASGAPGTPRRSCATARARCVDLPPRHVNHSRTRAGSCFAPPALTCIGSWRPRGPPSRRGRPRGQSREAWGSWLPAGCRPRAAGNDQARASKHSHTRRLALPQALALNP
jgi:hypothetical protein